MVVICHGFASGSIIDLVYIVCHPKRNMVVTMSSDKEGLMVAYKTDCSSVAMMITS